MQDAYTAARTAAAPKSPREVKEKNSHTIRLEKHHVPNRTLLLLLRPDGVYNITPGFSVKKEFGFSFLFREWEIDPSDSCLLFGFS